MNNNPLNYKIETNKVPNSQDLPDVFKLTFGFNIISKKLMLERKNVVGLNPLFYVVDEIESTDIDTQIDFDIAKFLFSKNNI